MPQYSNSFLLQDGGTVNAVFNTESNTVTYNVTTPQGQTATLTLPPDADPQSVTNLNNIRQQIRNQGGSALTIIGFGQGLQAVKYNTNQEASRAEASAIANNTTVPANPTPPPPVATVEPVIVNTPSTNDNIVNPNTDPNLNLGNETVNILPQPTTNVSLGTNALNEFATDTNLVVQGIDFAPTESAPAQTQQTTNVSLGTNALNEFSTDNLTQVVANEPRNDSGGEDVVEEQKETGQSDLDDSTVEPNVFGSDTDLEPDTDPNLTALEAGDVDEIESDEQSTLLRDYDELEADDVDEIESDEQSTLLRDYDELEADDVVNPDSNTTRLDSSNYGGYNSGEDEEQELIENGPNAPYSEVNSRGLSGALNNTRNQAGLQYGENFGNYQDWRVRLKLAPDSDYLYNAPISDRGILAPLNKTDGVIFPYTPQISVNYSASYDLTPLTHSNYKVAQYQSSGVDSVNITCDFTAQDNDEANYLLAVIHFFKSVTKMFYGQDQNPKRGTPPPLCYLVGLGSFQFDMHPLVVTNFAYNLPNDVDYVRATPNSTPTGAGVTANGGGSLGNPNLGAMGIQPGGAAAGARFSTPPGGVVSEPTYVPSKMQIQITCIPIISRNDISNVFSLKEYASGKLLQGSKRASGGIW